MSLFRRTPARRSPPDIDEEDIDLFVPLDELDAHCAADEVNANTGALVPALLDAAVPGLAVIAHGLTLLAELTDGMAPRPTPQAISDATRAYFQQPMRTRLGDRPGVWVRMPGSRRKRFVASASPRPAADAKPARLRLAAPRPSWAR